MNFEEENLSTESAESTPRHSEENNHTYGFDTGGIVSYVVPDDEPRLNIVEAVNVTPEDQIHEESTKKKWRFTLIGICIFGVLMGIVLTLVVVLSVTRRGTSKVDLDGNAYKVDVKEDEKSSKDGNPYKVDVKGDEKSSLTSFRQFSMFLKKTVYKDDYDKMNINNITQLHDASMWAWSSALEEGIDPMSYRMIQRFVLALFYFSTNGDAWVRCGRESTNCDETQEWLTGADECDWYAIECDEEGDVIEINFPPNGESSNNIRGPLPNELYMLSKLSVFIIARGPLSGPFPNWSRMSKLQQVLLNQNEFEGKFPTYLLSKNPLLGTIQFNNNNFEGAFLGDLESEYPIAVEDISVNGNDFSGPITSQIGKLSLLRHLDIGSNGISGTLPEELYSLTNLINLNVSDTRVSGEISTKVGAVSKLMEFHAGNTDMSGTLPKELFSLTQLRTLDLSNGTFDGTLSESFSNLADLDFAKLNDNQFTGTIPPGLENLPFLEHLELHGNNLIGSVPEELCNRRGEGFMQLQVLTVSCLGDTPEVSCDCCTMCV